MLADARPTRHPPGSQNPLLSSSGTPSFCVGVDRPPGTCGRKKDTGNARCSDPKWVFEGSTYYVKCNFQLLVDNLMDLSHETYVHPSSIGQPEIVEAPIKTTSDESSVTVTRWMYNIEPPPFWAANLRSHEKCDRWQICHFSLPANVMIDVGVALAGSGAPQGDRSKGVTGIAVNLMTPETETATWYHWEMVRNFQVEDRGLTFRIRDAQASVFAEDMEILDAQQQNILRCPERRLLDLKIDSGDRKS